MRRARAAALPIVRPDLVEFYLAHRAAQGMNTDHKVRWGARALLAAVPDVSGFSRLPLERQFAFNHETHRFIRWLLVTGRLQPGADYLVARRPRLGIVLARTEPELHLGFMETARALGFRETVAMSQFNLLAHFVALFGKQPHELQQSDWDGGRRRLLLEAARRIPNRGVKALSTALFDLEATLFHCELTDQLPRRRSPDHADMRAQERARVPAGMADTMQHSLPQIAGTMRPSTVKNAELTLREFALPAAAEDTGVTCVDAQATTRRTLPPVAAGAAGRPWRPTAPAHRPRLAEQTPQLLPPPGRVGRRRPAASPDGVRQRLPDRGRTAAPLPRRRRGRRAAGSRPPGPRSVQPAGS
ncbi:hypothetical protein [Streptomyces sp. Amel2xC10]|uniref:hypothetical protein n=1 Tax=Streptomyces sp. Amel2xC10 TaxID=1305826 RepID=UPI001C528521|nr:hypothetical protein [Streptomyces sp. Amel2xC10]